MATVVFIESDGTRRCVEVAAGDSVMNAAVNNGVPGIIGECGGHAMCATCHVFVPETAGGGLPAMSSDEDVMLDLAEHERRATSRLGCQIRMGDDLQHIEVEVP